MKVLLFALIRSFEFDLAVPVEDVFKSGLFVQRPKVKSDIGGGIQFPVKIRLVQP